MMDVSLSVVIPSKNGAEILRRYLPAIVKETDRAGGRVIVVDDCSDDDTETLVKTGFPGVSLLTRKQNPGFCHAVNSGMSIGTGRYLMVLNNDTIPSENSFSMLVKSLDESSENVAVAVPSIARPDGSDDSRYRWAFRRGLAVTGENISGKPYPSGACALWKAEIWKELGGLSSRYAPIYWEDTDMGVRMHQAGYSVLLCPDILVKHMHAATMGRSVESETLRERNRFIFMDANCRSFQEKLSRVMWLPAHLLRAEIIGNRAFTQGYRNYCQWRKIQK